MTSREAHASAECQRRKRWRTLITAILLASANFAFAQPAPLVDQVNLVQGPGAVNTPLPADPNNQAAVTLKVTTTGSYSITVTDLAQPSALAALNVSLATSTASVAQISAAGNSKSLNVTLTAGVTYTVTPLATATNGSFGGSFSVVISGPGNFQWQDVWTVSAASAPVQPGQSILSTQFKATDTCNSNPNGACNYTLTLSDAAFPVGLSSVQLIIVDSTGTPVAPTPINVSAPVAASVGLALPAGTYDLFVIAQATSPADAGLYGLQIVGGSSGTSVVFDATEPVGSLTAGTPLKITAAGTVSLEANDLAYPAALGAFQALVAQGSGVLARIPTSTGSTPVQFPVSVGTAQVYVLVQPGAGGQGSYALYATEGGATLADVAAPVLDSTHYGYAYAVSSLAGGSYQLALHDYQLPQPFGSLSAAAEQLGLLVVNSQVQGTSNESAFTAAAGASTILVFPTLQAAGDDSLFGVVLSATGVSAFNATQGVGAAFSSVSVNIASGGNYALQATDLGFTAPLSSLFVILTSGQSVTNEIVGAGEVPVTVNAPGTYVMNVLAQVGAGANYGLYGLQFEQAAKPTVTLTANPTSVAAGGQTQLSWSSNGATSCTASGGWNGALATSGSEQSSALNATTTFAITCTGSGGSASASVAVTLKSSSGGGGGALSGQTIGVLLGLAAWVLWRRRAATSSFKETEKDVRCPLP
jgi:hypothetical protein